MVRKDVLTDLVTDNKICTVLTVNSAGHLCVAFKDSRGRGELAKGFTIRSTSLQATENVSHVMKENPS